MKTFARPILDRGAGRALRRRRALLSLPLAAPRAEIRRILGGSRSFEPPADARQREADTLDERLLGVSTLEGNTALDPLLEAGLRPLPSPYPPGYQPLLRKELAAGLPPLSSHGSRRIADDVLARAPQVGALRTRRTHAPPAPDARLRPNMNAARELLPPTTDVAANRISFRKDLEGFRSGATMQARHATGPARPARRAGHPPASRLQRQKHKLETDLGSAAGVTCPISTAKLRHKDASLDITFDLGGTILTAQDINNIAVFVNNWHGAALSVPVRIHGYASKDGAPTFNWPLSCRRAEAVAKQMQKVQPAVTLSTKHKFPAGTPGIPAGFVTGFAHGETEEFSKAALPPNRRATVHVPALPSVPKKLPKAPGASLKSGPTYKPNGPLKATLTKTSKTRWRKRATFHMAAEFDDAPAKGTLASCGEIRQYIRWSSDAVDPGKVGHEGFFTDKTYLANTWYEDRHQRNIRYGHRRGPHTFKGGVVNQYLNAKKKPDFLKGAVYQGRDRPSFGSSPARVTAFTGSWEFRLVALDVCRNSVLGDDTVTVLF